MKKLTVITFAIAVALLSFISCKNNKKVETEIPEFNQGEEQSILDAELKVNAQNLVESAKKIKPVPFASATSDGRIKLSDKEKMVKPDYLLDPALATKAVTFSQKYRLAAMLAPDLIVAGLYDMPQTAFQEALTKLLVDLDDEALKTFASTPWIDWENTSEAMTLLVDQEYEAGRQNFYWEFIAASLVEQIYIITRDVDKFMPMFNDESASEITFNFICLHESLLHLVELNPEMESLNEALTPLYVINAIKVDQLRNQLLSLKQDIENARAFLLK